MKMADLPGIIIFSSILAFFTGLFASFSASLLIPRLRQYDVRTIVMLSTWPVWAIAVWWCARMIDKEKLH